LIVQIHHPVWQYNISEKFDITIILKSISISNHFQNDFDLKSFSK